MTKNQAINKLKQERREIQQDISAITEQKKLLTDEIFKKRLNLSKVDKKLKTLQKEFSISDHALVRYLERVYFKDNEFDVIKNELMERISPYTDIGDCDVKIDKKYTAIIRDNLLVTVKQS